MRRTDEDCLSNDLFVLLHVPHHSKIGMNQKQLLLVTLAEHETDTEIAVLPMPRIDEESFDTQQVRCWAMSQTQALAQTLYNKRGARRQDLSRRYARRRMANYKSASDLSACYSTYIVFSVLNIRHHLLVHCNNDLAAFHKIASWTYPLHSSVFCLRAIPIYLGRAKD